MTWECIAVTSEDYKSFLDSLRNTRDADEKILRNRIEEQVMPIIEQEEMAHERQKAKREKEMFNLQLIAGAKRSSRLAEKTEKERHDREAIEAEYKREADLAAARRDEERLKKMETDRHSRIMTREQRIKDRERKRVLHEAELQRINEEQDKLARGESRISERQLKAELEKQRRNLEDLSQEDEWIFDCSGCGVHGENLVSSMTRQRVVFTNRRRTMAPIVWHAKTAMCGSTASALGSRRPRPSVRTFISSAGNASVARKKRSFQNFRRLNSESVLRLQQLWRVIEMMVPLHRLYLPRRSIRMLWPRLPMGLRQNIRCRTLRCLNPQPTLFPFLFPPNADHSRHIQLLSALAPRFLHQRA